MLMQQHRFLAARGEEYLPPASDFGFHNYSVIAATMIADLIINHDLWGFCSTPRLQRAVRGESFANNKDAFLHAPRVTKGWIAK
jgi:hypothetical protein